MAKPCSYSQFNQTASSTVDSEPRREEARHEVGKRAAATPVMLCIFKEPADYLGT